MKMWWNSLSARLWTRAYQAFGLNPMRMRAGAGVDRVLGLLVDLRQRQLEKEADSAFKRGFERKREAAEKEARQSYAANKMMFDQIRRRALRAQREDSGLA